MSRKAMIGGGQVLDTNNKLVYNLVFKDTIRASAVSAADTATKLPNPPLARRISMIIQNYGSQIVFIGASDVNITEGFPLLPRATLQLSLEEEIDVYGIVASGTADIRLLEGA